ncbi:Arginyl-tRNA synthetase [Fulvivirga imtechensis AK7]|uniref:Arginine--tRNA ligase n=1 Tax=Fulvivirga imtechensis AK7 TaxID=1237149 RepID=L8JJV4_9BACT|nr:arginine--tRNA ligase [Fulvivirga imtechensis]ELR68538.1 Arginyl-tRNA synthetase [Fulvivirga imtechensis AK7]
MNIESILKEDISKAFKSLFDAELNPEDISLQPTRKEFEGSHTFVCFPYARLSKKSPEETGNVIGEYLKENSEAVGGFNVVKGFLNIVLTDATWLSVFSSIFNTQDYGVLPSNGKEVMVEYSSPNTNKPLHLGHLRNNFLGWSVAEILKANGNKVHKVQIINDRGIHICKSMIAWLKFGNAETPESTGKKGDKLVGDYYVKFDQEYKKQIAELIDGGATKEQAEKEAPIMQEAQELLRKWEEKDPEVYALWQKMNEWVYKGFDGTYRQMGVDFDKLYYESETYLLGKDEVMKGVEQGIFFQKEDGSVWVDLTGEGLDQKLLLRADGTSVYMTQDIGTAILRFRDFPKIAKQIYTVGNEQEYHFKVLFIILDKLGYKWAKECYHLSYGMVDLPTGKMKSREGTVVDADDLMQEMIDTARVHTEELGKIEGFTEQQAGELYETLGIGALKYFLLKVDPKKRMLFDPNESIQFQGNTGPFIQYTHARISAILRKADQLGLHPQTGDFSALSQLHPTEKSVIFLLNEYVDKVKEAGTNHSPDIIAQYVYDLAKEYNRFYQEVSIFNEEDEQALKFRVAFSKVVAETIKRAMGLLGISVPERM